jgi:hypothetical protein
VLYFRLKVVFGRFWTDTTSTFYLLLDSRTQFAVFLSPPKEAFSFCGWRRRPTDMEGRCEYTEYAVIGSRKEMVFHLECWIGVKNSTPKKKISALWILDRAAGIGGFSVQTSAMRNEGWNVIDWTRLGKKVGGGGGGRGGANVNMVSISGVL